MGTLPNHTEPHRRSKCWLEQDKSPFKKVREHNGVCLILNNMDAFSRFLAVLLGEPLEHKDENEALLKPSLVCWNMVGIRGISALKRFPLRCHVA